jgi:hypothetical protein
MRLRSFAPLAASAAIAVLIAACGGSATAAPNVAAPSVAASVAPSVEPSPSPAASTAAAASGALPSIGLPNQDTNLEALLPSTFGGVKLQKISMKGAQFLGQSTSPEFNNAMSALGLTAADVSVAVAADPTGTSGVTFLAIRFAGADSGKLSQVFQAASQASGDVVTSVNLAGKDVLKAKSSNGDLSYYYVKNDTVFGVTGPKDDTAAAAALAVLP